MRVLAMVLLVSGVGTIRRPSSEMCYFQPYYKQLTCTCINQGEEATNYLRLNMNHYVRNLGQEVNRDIIDTSKIY